MLILLPPSEGKHLPTTSKKLNLGTLSFADQLTEARSSTLKELKIDISHCEEAISVYSGVLYQGLAYETLNSAARKRAEKAILIISAVFGALKIKDVIPFYKAKIVPSHWKGPLAEALDGLDEQLIVDMRSSTYLSVWTPNPLNTVGIRIFTKVDGEKKVITHMSKKYRGEIARYLLEQKSEPTTPVELYKLIAVNFKCTLIKPVGKKSWFIDVIV